MTFKKNHNNYISDSLIDTEVNLWFMVFNGTFNNILVIINLYIVEVSLIDERHRSVRRKPPTYHKSLINFIT
jgi:hypothetical protein